MKKKTSLWALGRLVFFLWLGLSGILKFLVWLMPRIKGSPTGALSTAEFLVDQVVDPIFLWIWDLVKKIAVFLWTWAKGIKWANVLEDGAIGLENPYIRGVAIFLIAVFVIWIALEILKKKTGAPSIWDAGKPYITVGNFLKVLALGMMVFTTTGNLKNIAKEGTSIVFLAILAIGVIFVVPLIFNGIKATGGWILIVLLGAVMVVFLISAGGALFGLDVTSAVEKLTEGTSWTFVAKVSSAGDSVVRNLPISTETMAVMFWLMLYSIGVLLNKLSDRYKKLFVGKTSLDGGAE